MPAATLPDGSTLDVTTLGDGPAVLLPVRTDPLEEAQADAMRAWGADPDLGALLARRVAGAGFRVVAADYEAHLAAHPRPGTLTADAVTADLLAVADAAGADRFAYYGYSWLALAGLQLALRTDRLTGLAMGGYPPLDGPYAAMLAVTRAAHRLALAHRDAPRPASTSAPEPGDWDSVEMTQAPEQTGQYVTLYESLAGFDDAAALTLAVPRLAVVGADDDIVYGPGWGDVEVVIAGAVTRRRAELEAAGWTVEVLPGKDHTSAMQADAVLPVLLPWLTAHRGRPDLPHR
ncbi:alpha/beta hydrolase [Isoptericola sp. NPDC057653]|uniref:alpha/beta hydrolase n=1 Tax=Isoptericola sp. NPDC057653 TaxID=3346195 RepID=UPI00369BA7BB